MTNPIGDRTNVECWAARHEVTKNLPPKYMMTLAEWLPYGVEVQKQSSHSQPESFYEDGAKLEHRWAVEYAIKNEIEVPERVLEGYPYLVEAMRSPGWYFLKEGDYWKSELVFLFGNEIQICRYERDHSIVGFSEFCGKFNPDKDELDSRRVILDDLYPMV